MKFFGLLAALVILTSCATTTTEVARCPPCRGPVVYPPYKGPLPKPTPPGGELPPDPGPGFLYTRVVYGRANDAAFAYVVHVGDAGTRLLAIVGPLQNSTEKEKDRNDYPAFSAALCKRYGKHGPGQGSCCADSTRAPGGGASVDGPKKITLTPVMPPTPPPPSSGFALVYSFQDAAVSADDPQTAGDAVGAASTGVTALNGG
jgi:hypothetical protein